MVRSGITSDTPKRYVVDAGEVRINYQDGNDQGSLLGATMDGNEFVIETEIRDPRPDGARGKVKGLRTYNDIAVQLTANLFEITLENLENNLPGVSTSDDGTHQVLSQGVDISDNDYIDNVAIIGTLSGSDEPIICIVKNALADDGFELSMADRDDVVQAVTFSGHFDPSSLETAPYEIRYPSDLQATT